MVLVSVGRNPVTDRPRLPPDEATAIAMAVRAGLSPRLVHAGTPEAVAALRRGLGLGALALDIIDIGERGDPLAALIARLKEVQPAILFCGARAGTGEGSGMVPYRLGTALGQAVIADCVDLDCREGSWIARTRASGGARRLMGLPANGAVLIVAPGAGGAPLGSRRAADRGCVTFRTVIALDDSRHNAPARPARRLPPPISPPRDVSGAGRILTDAEAAAEAILALLDALHLR